jgi:transposase
MQSAINSQQKQPLDVNDLTLQVSQLQAENRLLETQLEAKKRQLQEYEKLIKLYEEAERLAKIQRFGPGSEKSKFQFQFFDEVELEQALDDLDQQIAKEEAAQKA